MDSKKTFMLIFSLIIILTLSQVCLSVGMRGPIKYFKIFSPNEHIEIDYGIMSNMPPMDVKIQIVEPSEMEGAMNVDKESVFLKPSQEKPVRVTIDLPSEVKTPGPHVFWIKAMESPPKIRGGAVGAKGTVKMSITIFVPYPGKYLQGSIEVKPVAEGEEVAMDLILINLGGETINSVKAVAEIYDLEGNKIDTLQAYQPGNKNDFDISIGAEQTKKMYLDWMPKEGVKGKFKVRVLIDYDGIKLEVDGTLNVGYKDVKILNTSKQLEAGVVAEYFVLAESMWNDVLYDVFTEVDFFNSTGDKIDSVRSTREELYPFKDFWFRSYWNTRNLELGNYTALVKVYFDDMVVEGKYPVELVEPKVPFVEEPIFTTGTILVILLVFVILIIIGGNVFFFMYVRKKKKKPMPEKKIEKVKKKKSKTKEELEITAEEELAELEKMNLD